MKHCSGFQPSSRDEWLQPLATWFAPAVAFLLLVPPEEVEEKQKTNNGAVWDQLIWIRGYVTILGDPASALGGALMDVVNDFEHVARFCYVDECLEKDTTAFVILAGHLKYRKNEPLGAAWCSGEGDEDSIRKRKHAIKMILSAKTSFLSGVFLPCVLAIAVAAATLNDYYGKKGDSTTGLNLAYGVWYNWLLVLAVVCNCSINSISSDVAQLSFKEVLPDLVTSSVPLRKRYANTAEWNHWLNQKYPGGQYTGVGASDTHNASSRMDFDGPFYLKFVVGQTLGWCCVAFFTACATVIAYTTPTVGIGCRSMNFILYAATALLICLLVVFRHWVENSGLASGGDRTKRFKRILDALYCTLVLFNFLVIFGGTGFHLAGRWHTCRCMSLFGRPGDLIELAPYTKQAKENAENFWLLIAHVSYSISWLIIVVCVAVRSYVIMRLESYYYPRYTT